jgi:hypothetical protein
MHTLITYNVDEAGALVSTTRHGHDANNLWCEINITACVGAVVVDDHNEVVLRYAKQDFDEQIPPMAAILATEA